MPPFRVALVVLCTVIWGFNFVAIKVGLQNFPPLLFTAMRFVLASLPFLAFVKPPNIRWPWVIAIGLFLGVFQFGFLFTGMALGMPPGLSSTVMQTQVFFTVILAVLALGEKPRWQNLAGLVIAFSGALVIAGHLGDVPMIPFLMVVAGALSWAISNILTRRAGASDAFRLIVWVSAVPPLPLLALSWAIEGQARIVGGFTTVSWLSVAALAFVAFAATTIAFGLWSWLLKRHPAATVAPFALLVPFWGIGSSMLVFDEQLSLAKAIGCALIVAGIAANSWPARRLRSI